MLFINQEYLASKPNYCLGITLWKRENFLMFLGDPQRKQTEFIALGRYEDAIAQAKENDGRVICWSSSTPEGLFAKAKEEGVEVILVEDGFIRSAGLGIKLNMPASLCFSRLGIHYSSKSSSDLEIVLQQHWFTDQQREDGRAAIEELKARRVTKYNLKSKQGAAWPDKKIAKGQKRILVIGQVGDDASLRFGSPFVKSNVEMLKAVHKEKSHHSIVYKPHPDVVSGLRLGHIPKRETDVFCNAVSMNEDILSLIQMADEVHVISSQAGIEALLYDKHVICHGQPFYSGWGLTQDIHPQERRTTKLSLEELIYAAFVAYPCYINPFDGSSSDLLSTIRLISEAKDWPRAPRSYMISIWFKRRLRALKKLRGKR